jgi:hypothetical protein
MSIKEVMIMEQKRKFTGKEKAVLAILVIAMIAVVGVGAYIIVSNVNSANEQATATQNTTVEYTHPVTTEEASNADNTEKTGKESKTKTKSHTASGSEKTESKSVGSISQSPVSGKTSKSTASKSTPAKSKSKSKSKTKSQSSSKQKGNKIPVYTPQEHTSHASEDVCYVNGKKCYVGDTITMTLNLKTPVVLINYQGYTTFDNSVLEFKTADSESGALTNCKGNKIYYNASVLSGLDFTSTGTVYYAKFVVKKTGNVTIDNTFEVMSDLADDSQVPLSKCTVGIEIFD